MLILHHRFTDSLVITSHAVTCASAFSTTAVAPLIVRPFSLIWDWKRNVPGLTLASSAPYHLYHQRDAAMFTVPSLFSWFQLGEDDEHGLCAVHVYEHTASRAIRRARKNVFSLSSLSPLNRFDEGSLSLNEPSAVLLHRDSVTFPFITRVRTYT